MNTGVKILLFFVYFVITTEASSKLHSTNECEEIEQIGNWTCIRNDDNTVNITFDCSRNGLKDVELQIYSLEYPKKMKSLKIQNCEDVVLDIGCVSSNVTENDEKEFSVIEWSNLHVVNITNLRLKKSKRMGDEITTTEDPFGMRDRYHWIHRHRYPYWQRPGYSDFDTEFEPDKLIPGPLRNVIFENVVTATFEHDLEFPSSLKCRESFTQLEYLKFINVNVAEHFKIISKNVKILKELVLDRVTFLLDRNYRQLEVNNETAIVEIINSSFIPVEEIFKGKVSKLIVRDNEFATIAGEGFNFEADEFVFSGNSVARLKESAFSVKTVSAHITNNIIHQVDESVFDDIRPRSSKSSSNNGIYNFSSNEMHILDKLSLFSPFMGSTAYFNTIKIFNNSINCSCMNLELFEAFLNYKLSKSHLYKIWFKTANQNKCLNIQNCTLHQAMFNFYEFCEEDYQCPQNVSAFDKFTHPVMEMEEQSKISVDSNRKIAESALKILDILKGDSKNFDRLESLFVINTLFLLVLLFLIIVILGHFICLKFFDFSCFSFRTRKLKSLDTEMHSQVCLTN